jgi:hypothetical protein
MRAVWVLLLAVVVTTVGVLTAYADDAGLLDTNLLPFDRPSRAALAKSPRKVVAHWTALPMRYYTHQPSYDGYVDALDPAGEKEKHFHAGGYLRNRPIPVPMPFPAGYAEAGAYHDIQLAAEIGIDAFMMNCWYGPEDWRWQRELTAMFDAADIYSARNSPGFSIAPNIDGFVVADQIQRLPGSKNSGPERFADNFAQFKDRRSFLKINGKYVVGVFSPESLPLAWYRTFRDRLLSAHKMELHLIAFFLDPTHREKYAATFDVYSRFDILPHSIIESEAADRKWAKDRGKGFVSGVGQSYDRPDGGVTIESGGFRTEIGSWERAISDEADMAHIITWNDHYEGSNLRPNTGSQYAYYDIAAYYIAWYKTGERPPIVRDVLYYSHRMHAKTARYDPKAQRSPTASKNMLPVEDNIYLLGFLKSAGTLSIRSGGRDYAQAFGPGIHTLTAPLSTNDQPRFTLKVDGATTVDFASAFETRGDGVRWHDFYYRAGSSSRSPVAGVQNNLPEDRWSKSPK